MTLVDVLRKQCKLRNDGLEASFYDVSSFSTKDNAIVSKFDDKFVARGRSQCRVPNLNHKFILLTYWIVIYNHNMQF